MRLDRLLARMGLGTRSEVRALLRAGRVSVDGRGVTDAALPVDESKALVALDGKRLVYRDSVHLMMNKPAGVLTAASDARRLTVQELLPKEYTAIGCMPVGRLDLDTEGLLLFTTDGALAHRLLSPKRHVEKEYIADVDAPLSGADIVAFAEGIPLGDFTAMPAGLAILPGGTRAKVTVCEGKFHQVKRMFEARGKRVTHLARVAFGGISLDPALGPGEYRELTDEELARLISVSGGN